MNPLLKARVETYKLHRGLITDIIRELSDEHLEMAAGKGMGSLGKQFKHIGRIQLGYIDGLRTGKTSFYKKIGDPSLEKSRGRLLSFLEGNDQEMFDILTSFKDEELNTPRIDYAGKAHQYGDKLSVLEHLDDLTRHEILHQGMLAVYLITLGVSFPNSWKLWGSGFLRRNR